jgi:hypothetical protein
MVRPSLPQSPVDVSALWSLVLNQSQIDPAELAHAIESQFQEDDLDFRTRLLVRDSLTALTVRWGKQNIEAWLADSAHRDRIRTIMQSDLGAPGFPSLRERVMETTKKETVLQFLRELGSRVAQSATLFIGGSIALILRTDLSRRTEAMDVVDEVPAPVRTEHEPLNELSRRYGLQITHFQSHYLPNGWASRLKPLGRFGQLDASTVDEYDVLLSKLFSSCEKDRDDLRLLAPQLSKATLVERLNSACASLLGEPDLRKHAASNWYIVFGETLSAVPSP